MKPNIIKINASNFCSSEAGCTWHSANTLGRPGRGCSGVLIAPACPAASHLSWQQQKWLFSLCKTFCSGMCSVRNPRSVFLPLLSFCSVTVLCEDQTLPLICAQHFPIDPRRINRAGAACWASRASTPGGKQRTQGPQSHPCSPQLWNWLPRVSSTLSFSLQKEHAAEIRHINHVLNKSSFEGRLGRK